MIVEVDESVDEVDGGFALVETGEVQDIEAAEYQFEPG